MPAQKRFGADDSVRRELHLRLVVETELTAFQPEAELMLDAEEFARLSGHLGAEDLVAISTGILCGVHRDIRIADEFFAVA